MKLIEPLELECARQAADDITFTAVEKLDCVHVEMDLMGKSDFQAVLLNRATALRDWLNEVLA